MGCKPEMKFTFYKTIMPIVQREFLYYFSKPGFPVRFIQDKVRNFTLVST